MSEEHQTIPAATNAATLGSDVGWMPVLLNAAAAIMCAALVVAAYHFAYIVQQPRAQWGTLDVAELMHTKELMMTVKAMSPDTSEEQRGQVYEDLKNFGQQLEAVIADVQRECDCTVMVRNALVKAPNVIDLTDTARQRLGLTKSVAQLTDELRRMGNNAKEDPRGKAGEK